MEVPDLKRSVFHRNFGKLTKMPAMNLLKGINKSSRPGLIGLCRFDMCFIITKKNITRDKLQSEKT